MVGETATEKVVKLCRKAWRVVHRLPDEFDTSISNPWLGVTLETRVKKNQSGGDARADLMILRTAVWPMMSQKSQRRR